MPYIKLRWSEEGSVVDRIYLEGDIQGSDKAFFDAIQAESRVSPTLFSLRVWNGYYIVENRPIAHVLNIAEKFGYTPLGNQPPTPGLVLGVVLFQTIMPFIKLWFKENKKTVFGDIKLEGNINFQGSGKNIFLDKRLEAVEIAPGCYVVLDLSVVDVLNIAETYGYTPMGGPTGTMDSYMLFLHKPPTAAPPVS